MTFSEWKITAAFGLASIISGCDQQQAAKPSSDVTIGRSFSIFSETLSENRDYIVYLPSSYDNKVFAPQHYPVLYLLDGGPHFHSVSGVVQFMSSGINGNRQIPELIIVAIPNTNRTRDLTPTHTAIGYDGERAAFLEASGGGDRFLQFINDELFEEIDSKYRTLRHRTIVGHSFGGLLALHALIHRPEVFQSYIAIDPSLWWHDRLLIRQAEESLEAINLQNTAVYLSMASHPASDVGEVDLMQETSRDFSGILATKPIARFPIIAAALRSGGSRIGTSNQCVSRLTQHFRRVQNHGPGRRRQARPYLISLRSIFG